jgi:hypothetical protein
MHRSMSPINIARTISGPYGVRRRAVLLDSRVDENSRAVAVSGDGRHFIYTKVAPDSADIMLVQGFP